MTSGRNETQPSLDDEARHVLEEYIRVARDRETLTALEDFETRAKTSRELLRAVNLKVVPVLQAGSYENAQELAREVGLF